MNDLTKHQNITGMEDFFNLPQEKASNRLTKELLAPAQLNLLGDGEIISNNFRLFIRGYRDIPHIRPTAVMLLDALIIKAMEQGFQYPLVKISLKEYMEIRSLTDEKETRDQIKRDINALDRVRFEFKGYGKQKGSWLNVTLSGGTSGITKGYIVFRFNEEYFNIFRASNGKLLYMHFPKEALQSNTHKNPYQYHLIRKISEHKRMNTGKPNENIISARTLTEDLPGFPTYKEVMATDRAISRRMIEPFERDLDASENIFSWEYTEDQPDSYETFINSRIKINWRAYPDTTRLSANKKRRAQKTAKSRADNKKISQLEERVAELEKGTEKKQPA